MRAPAGIRLVNERRAGADVFYDVTITWWYRLLLQLRGLVA